MRISLRKINKLITDAKFLSDSLILQNKDIMNRDYLRIRIIEELRRETPNVTTVIQLVALQEALRAESVSRESGKENPT